MSTKTRKAPAQKAARKKPPHKIPGQYTKAEAAAALGVSKAVLTIPEFCAMHGISNGLYFKLKNADKGPTEMHIGSRVVISHEAAAAWRKSREVEPTKAQPEAAE